MNDKSSIDVMEMEVSFHSFPWVTKKALVYLRESYFHKSLPVLGFVIEGREESELPEVLIGLCQLCHPKPKSALTWEELVRNHSNTKEEGGSCRSLPTNDD